MAGSAGSLGLKSYDSIFTTEEERQEQEKVVRLPLAELHSFRGHHPFQVRDDEQMRDTVESVKRSGVLVPALVRPVPPRTPLYHPRREIPPERRKDYRNQ